MHLFGTLVHTKEYNYTPHTVGNHAEDVRRT